MKLGVSFGDSIRTEKIPFYKKRHHENPPQPTLRDYLFPFFIIVIGIVLVGRLVFLQLLSGNYYQGISDTNRTRTTLIHAPRGIIFDRNGNQLVYNKPGYRETINGKTVLLSEKDALNKIAAGDTHLEIDSLRNYPLGEAAAHVVGYIGQISPNELKMSAYQGYQANDLVGEIGIEEQYEPILRGTDGKILTEVDAMGKPIRTLGQTDPVSGQNISLTLDSNLQKIVYQSMQPITRGAAIISTPQGEILAIVSKPSFDPNLFTMGKAYQAPANDTYKKVEQVLLDGTGQPLLNRPISGLYPPGSTFKLITAATALETHTIDATYQVQDTGVLKVGNFSFANWYYTDYGRTDGMVDVTKAIARSNDIFFYTVGQLLGVDKLSAFAKKFGLGNTLGIVLPGEAKGLVPTKEWKKQVIHDQWYLGDDYAYAIGQGFLLTTPLQVNVWTQVVANGGTLFQPKLVLNQPNIVKQDHIISTNTQSLLRQGMIAACSPGGVAYPFYNFSVKNPSLQIDGQDITESASQSADFRHVVVACKTGTAQEGGVSSLPHAWITLFAPAYHPQIVVTILSEEAGEGSDIAGPVAKNIVSYYFSQKKNK